MLSDNLRSLRRRRGENQEQVAEAVGITRQALSKWESGASLPDLPNCAALADYYGVTVDDLLRYDPAREGLPVPPRGKHSFGTVTLGPDGSGILPEMARRLFRLAPGDRLVLLGDEAQGLALVKEAELARQLAQLGQAEG